MKSNEFKPFKELSHTDKLLRLDWFGGVKYNLHEHDNPLVECIFTPIELPNPKNGKITPKPKRADQFMAGIAVGFLPIVFLGQYFKKGKWAPPEEWLKHETITFELNVSDATSVTECTLPDMQLHQTSDFIAPRFKRTANKSGVKKLNGILRRTSRKDIKKINVPQDVFIHEMELIRFYLTNSSHSCKNIFSSAFSKDNIQTRVKNDLHDNDKTLLDPQTGAGRILYRHGYREKDAPILGRILLDPDGVALNAAQRVSSKIIADRINSETDWLGYPRTNFPFLGTTRLVLSGRRLKTATGFIFLAYRIHSCSAPFPFKSLSYCDEITPGGKPAPEDAPVAFPGSKAPETGPAHEPGEHGNSTSTERPSAASVQLKFEFNERIYQGLDGVLVFQEKLRDCTHRSEKKTPRHLDDLRDASTGGGTTGESSAARQSLTEDIVTPSPVTPDLDTFIKVIQELRKLHPDWTITTIIIGIGSENNGEQTSYFPKVACQKLNKIMRQFSYIDDMKKERRRFICVQILVNGRYIYLFEAQRRLRTPLSPKSLSTYKEFFPILLLRKPSYEEVDGADFLPIIEQTVRNKTWPGKDAIDGFVKAYTVHGKGVKNEKDMCARVSKLIARSVHK